MDGGIAQSSTVKWTQAQNCDRNRGGTQKSNSFLRAEGDTMFHHNCVYKIIAIAYLRPYIDLLPVRPGCR